MQYRQLGDSDLQVSAVVFGAWAAGGWMWGGIDDEEVVRAMRAAVEAGSTTIDTAPIYGFGHSERLVGEAIRGMRDRVIVASKCCLRWDTKEGELYFRTKHEGKSYDVHKLLSKESVKWECEESLRRLGIETIDLYQCHWEDPTTPLEETMEAMLELKDEGKIRALGVSNFSAENIRKCKPMAGIASDQPRYSPLRRGIEADVLPACREQNVGVLAYSPLEHGLLSGTLTKDRKFKGDDLRDRHPWTQRGNRARLIQLMEHVSEIAHEYSATPAQVIINWVLSEPGITAAIVGARSEKQARENADAARFELAEAHRADVRRLFENLGEPRKGLLG